MRTQTQFRLGKIRYLNCMPYFFGLEDLLKEKGLEHEVSFFESYPTAINEAMQKGEVDAGPISSLEYLQHQDEYLLMGPAIGSRIFSRSVLLLSRKKVEDLDGAAIALSEESRSSAGLLRILLKQRYELKVSYETVPQDLEAMLKKYPAALVIGDQALFCQPKEMLYKYDLGEMWQAWTGKPFVFAVWAVRKDFFIMHPEPVRILSAALRENLLKNLGDPEALLRSALKITPQDHSFCQLLGYLINLHYELDEEMKAGLLRFFELAHEEGLVPVPQPLKVIE